VDPFILASDAFRVRLNLFPDLVKVRVLLTRLVKELAPFLDDVGQDQTCVLWLAVS